MRNSFPKLLVAGVMSLPLFAFAQSTIDADKRAAIKDLLDAVQVDKIAQGLTESARNEARQMVPAILQQALIEDKSMSDAQKQAAVPHLQKDVIPQLASQAGQVFADPSFKSEVVKAHYEAYAKFYTAKDIRDLTTFYKSPVGKKFIEVQPQVGNEILSGLMSRYMPQSIKATRDAADKAVAASASAK